MIKSRECKFFKKCKLERECTGCPIPGAAGEYEFQYNIKTRQVPDPDARGISEMRETFGDAFEAEGDEDEETELL